MDSIKLSILIPTYNFRSGINKILDCIESIEDDLRNFIEIIISDDSDEKIIEKKRNESLTNSFKHYVYNHNVKNLGAIDNWNKLISIAKGDYLWLLHHDEFWHKEKNIIRYILETINNEKPNILILPITKSKCTKLNNYNIQILNRHFICKKILRRFINKPKLLLQTNIIGPPSSLIYKRTKINYDKKLKYLVDIEFYIKLFNFYNSKKIVIGSDFYSLISSQNNKNSITRILRREIKSLKNREKFIISKRYKLKFNFQEKIISLYSYFILKIFSLIKTKINIEKS